MEEIHWGDSFFGAKFKRIIPGFGNLAQAPLQLQVYKVDTAVVSHYSPVLQVIF
jgi:hypothetical protein